MMVSVTLSSGEGHNVEPGVVFHSPPEAAVGELRHETLLAVGVRVVIDLADPSRWQSVTVASWNAAAEPVVQALVGSEAVERLTIRLREIRSGPADSAAPGAEPHQRHEQVQVDLSGAGPWLRIATADALDRWLQLPLDQSLIDAERSVVRSRAAMTLPDGPARQSVLAEALTIARRASRGLAGYLNALSLHAQPLPAEFHAALKQLVDGYGALLAEVKGPDRELRRILVRWARLGLPPPTGSPKPRADEIQPIPEQITGDPRSTNVIDPRQMPARVLRVAPDPATAEILVLAAPPPSNDAVLIRVPAYGRAPSQSRSPSRIRHRMLVRLIDRRSGAARGEALLTLNPDEFFVGVVPLHGARIDDVRADVFDALSEVPPATRDGDAALQKARRAVQLLREWRQGLGTDAAAAGSGPRPDDLLVAELAAQLAGPPSDGPAPGP